MKCFKAVGKLSLLALLLVSSASRADIIKYDFTATGTSTDFEGDVTSNFPSTGAGAYLSVGTQITGSFYYDTTTHALFTGATQGGNYADYYAASGIGITASSASGYHFVGNYQDPANFIQPMVEVSDTGPGAVDPDHVLVADYQLDANNGQHDLSLLFSAKPGTQPLTNSDLPTSLSLGNYNGELDLWWSDNGGNRYFTFTATVDSLTRAATVVPEPETYAMLMAGLMLIGGAARRSKRSGK